MRKVDYDHITSELKFCECGCNELIHSINKLGKPAKYKYNHHLKFYIGPKHSHWKGGKRWREGGYILVWNPDHPSADYEGYVLEHRLVWEQYYNACLLPWADVHHKNKNVKDNRIENLQAMIHGQHARYHRLNP